MSVLKLDRLTIEDTFDMDDELEIEIEGDLPDFMWLSREEVVHFRNHLNRVLGDI